MSTIYTLNGKVLKNAANDKWLIKAVPPPPPEEVTIGTQTWKIKNLAIDDGQGGIYTQTVNYGQGDVVEYYYTWNAAVRVAATVQGWHLPTKTELDTLATAVGGYPVAGTKLKSTYGWSSGNGDGSYGFAAFPAGQRSSSGSFQNLGWHAWFWTDTKSSSSMAFNFHFSKDASMDTNGSTMSYGYSVRLVKDA
jgi:uncharacterized protein (TIGR02145 family)